MAIDRPGLVHKLFDSVGHIRRFFAHAPQPPNGLPTHAQLWLMMIIAHEEPMVIQEITKRMSLSPSAVSRLVAGLESIGVVERTMHGDDRRKVVVAITEQGRQVLADTKKERVKLFAKIFDVFTDDELMTLMKLHEKFLQKLKTYEA